MMMVTPSKIITFVDSSVLINAIAGLDPARKMRAVSILGDQRREFVATRFLQLEVLPIPTRYQRSRELNFYQRFFSRITRWLDEEPLIQPALDLACQYGLGGMDALHLAAAISLSAEFISAERPSKPFYQAYQNALSIY
ncbi:MAG: type II toxin-antitoxin system VapC family toxin [Blastocatellia bacterium]